MSITTLKSPSTFRLLSVAAAVALTGLASCRPAGSPDGSGSVITQSIALTGAGASFPAPLYQNWAI
jgi:ABC-type phosphate transport system substrate-binding protein